ncbi:hypothetical protein ACRE_030510 [Hapsidospora chrysogenum ATCC 11550]|uniref:Uncharacterized protein n=1 Tax=Hapsidospora chrysogenum (strain ATCC 11550 / CBS 779.69 / DSM 880 / IAM 14645 / JCM 23072 / IMI 49137) TaxID=857340 RepID=A0A086T9S1_HAPC1|nr:hypothetical protein ACRE_030510 [Hapsidospora chrysogenum ATCC 11550]
MASAQRRLLLPFWSTKTPSQMLLPPCVPDHSPFFDDDDHEDRHGPEHVDQDIHMGHPRDNGGSYKGHHSKEADGGKVVAVNVDCGESDVDCGGRKKSDAIAHAAPALLVAGLGALLL